MHITALNAPLRTAALCTRISGPLAPFAYSTSSSFQQSCRSVSTKQRHQAGTISKCQNNLSFQNIHQQDMLNSSRSQHVPSITKVVIRSNSTTSTDSTKSSSYTQGAPLDWNTFFKLRTSRRRYSLGSSIIASMASTAIGVQVLSGQDLENLGAQVMGLDPFIVLGLATAACGAAGWLAGPFLGNAVWGLVHRRYKSGVAVKEKEFYNRIKRHRVDPSSNSLANPVPDYYGEKIGSVQGYRQWLKDQRAYNRKKNRFIL
ncbi:hypothetical protein Plec18167_006056 [Paecilomyces lecythidis]|uniref:Presequence translocated-associated motor subunit PAM17 n=1 Tax=Paecilomyces lecythidis TaxID=3004212 RepID=A0ABR3XEL7_9EURO